MTVQRAARLLLLTTLLAACGGADSDPGLRNGVRVANAQYVAGRLPAAADGPAIVSLRLPHGQVLPGLRRELVTGSLSVNAQAVLLGRDGEPGYWIISAGA